MNGPCINHGDTCNMKILLRFDGFLNLNSRMTYRNSFADILVVIYNWIMLNNECASFSHILKLIINMNTIIIRTKHLKLIQSIRIMLRTFTWSRLYKVNLWKVDCAESRLWKVDWRKSIMESRLWKVDCGKSILLHCMSLRFNIICSKITYS